MPTDWADPLRIWFAQLASFVPRLLLVLVVVAVAIVLARLTFAIVKRALRAVNVHVLTQRAGIDGALAQLGRKTSGVDLLAGLAAAGVAVVALLFAVEALGMPRVGELAARLTVFTVRLFFAASLFVLGAYFAAAVEDAIGARAARAGSVPRGDVVLLARAARIVMLVFVLLVAIDILDLGGRLVQNAFLIMLGGLVLAVALGAALAFGIAFGFAGREQARRVMSRWWPVVDTPMPPAPPMPTARTDNARPAEPLR